jgi:hypothetical protein
MCSIGPLDYNLQELSLVIHEGLLHFGQFLASIRFNDGLSPLIYVESTLCDSGEKS